MQATSPTYRAVTDTGWLTTSSLILMLIFAAVVMVAIVYGMRLASKRKAARRVEEERVEAETPEQMLPDKPQVTPEQARVEPPVAEPAAFAAPKPTPFPVAPAPPPLDAGPVAGTPAADPLPEAPDLADEPIAAAAPLDASPAIEAERATVADPIRERAADTRPLTTLKGLGPKVAARLGELGIATVGDLAALDDAQTAGIDARLGPFTGRMARDRWLEQARLLASGEDRAFEAEFGKL